MLNMEQVVEIQRLKHEEQKTYQEIQATLGVSSKTVAKALCRPEEFVEGYRREAPAQRPALGSYVERIEELLKGKAWARQKGRVVRRTARWVFRVLKKEGYTGAESTVRTYIRERFSQPRAACPIEHPAGDEVQFDFGECRVKIGDEIRLIHFVGAVFCYSTRRFVFAYPRERQECLMDAIERTYQKAGGVSQRATLDNTTLAVKKILEGGGREETEEYTRFRALLGVNPRYTNRGAGWEKGHVEGTVGWAKRQILLDLEVKDWKELWEVLEQECDKDARERRHGEEGKFVGELFEEERGLLRPFPYKGQRSYRRGRARVSPGGLVYVDGSRYSVPISFRGRHVRLELSWDEIVVKSERQEVARHCRDWSGRGEHYKIEHYLQLLRRAPALLDHGKPFVRMPEWLKKTRQALGDDKGLIELLLAVDSGKYTIRELEEAAREAVQSGCVTKALIEQRAFARRTPAAEVTELEEEECRGLGHHSFVIDSPEMYDELVRREREAS